MFYMIHYRRPRRGQTVETIEDAIPEPLRFPEGSAPVRQSLVPTQPIVEGVRAYVRARNSHR